MNIDYVFDAIKTEREYQKREWPNSKKLGVTGEITLLRSYLREFEENYRSNDDGADIDVPEICLHDLRKMAAILIRAMENHGAPKRL